MVFERFLTAVLVGMLWYGLPGTRCVAQDSLAAHPDAATLYQSYEQGVSALEADSAEVAVQRLASVFLAVPTYAHPRYGAVAYWLGRALEALGDDEKAGAVWISGFQALQAAGLSDLPLADAVVRSVYGREDEDAYALADEAYLLVLSYLDLDLSPEERALVDPHLERLVLILPEKTRQDAGLDGWEPGAPFAPLPAKMGTYLASWWRSRDPLPATRENERLEEHLRRVAYAEQHFRHPGTGTLDDRAAVYIRLGPAPRATHVTFEDFSFRSHVLNTVPSLTPSSFPDNEFWVYPHLDQAAQFLFVRRPDGAFRLGEPDDLIPPTLTMGLGFTQRGMTKAEALIWTMHEIYRQLAQQSPVFAPRYNETADYIERLEDNAFLAEMDRRSEVIAQRSADATRNTGGNVEAKDQSRMLGLPRLPNVYAETMVEQAHSDDKIAQARRAERVPRSYADAMGTMEPLEVAVRRARFLDADGTTRTEIYWSTSAKALQSDLPKAAPTNDASPLPYLLTLSIVQKTADHRERAVHYQGHLIDNAWVHNAGDVLSPRTYTVRGDTGTYHLAMQWDQYLTLRDDEGKPTKVGRHLKANTYRVDTLTALNADERVLEMSDLKPLLHLEEMSDAAQRDSISPYPFSGIASGTPLGLYFELYHLTYGPDDKTHYTVTYTVTQHAGNGLLRLRRGKTQQTAATTTYTGTERNTREYILVDLNDWEGTGELEITVQAIDEPTGRRVERALTFVLEK